MKTKEITFFLSITFLLATIFSVNAKNSGVAPLKNTGPGSISYVNEKPPYSDRDLLKIFGNIAKETDNYGFISKEYIEKEFQFSIPPASSLRRTAINLPDSTYATKAFENWYFDLLYVDYGKKRSDFSFGWGSRGKMAYPYSSSPQGYCIKFEDISAEFAAGGWSVRSQIENPTFTSVQYLKGKGKLLFSFDSTSSCMLSLFITSNTEH